MFEPRLIMCILYPLLPPPTFTLSSISGNTGIKESIQFKFGNSFPIYYFRIKVWSDKCSAIDLKCIKRKAIISRFLCERALNGTVSVISSDPPWPKRIEYILEWTLENPSV